MGYGAGSANTTGQNTLVGFQAGNKNTTGTNNTFMGINAGVAQIADSNNTFLGYNSSPTGDPSNSIYLGNTTTTSFLCPAASTTITSTNIQIGDGSALFQYMTPPLDMVLPPSITYSFVDPIYYATESQTSVPAAPALGSQTTLPLQNINLTSVPSMMYIWVSQRDRDNTFSSTDTYFSIENINITFKSFGRRL